MKTLSLVLAMLFLSSHKDLMAASQKVCFGSTKDDDTKGSVLVMTLDEKQVAIKTLKGDFEYDGEYPAYDATLKGRDGKVYMQYVGRQTDYQDVLLIDKELLKPSTTGLLQIRARGEGFFNSVFVCRDDKKK